VKTFPLKIKFISAEPIRFRFKHNLFPLARLNLLFSITCTQDI